jgi:hypothetical protein
MRVGDLPKQEILPAGPYRVGIKEIKTGVGKESGIAYLKPIYQVVDGAYKKRIIFDNLSLSPNALWRVRVFLEAIDCLDLELPIERGADGGLIVTDEEGLAAAIIQNSVGREMIVEVNEVPENKEKGYPAKNDVIGYSVAKSGLSSKWDE